MTTDDPERSLELLWGPRDRPSRGPKPKMSVEVIADVAIRMADADGLEAVSMRRIAESIGFTTMSLYRYVPSKAVLIDVMQDTAIGEVDWRELEAGGWRAGLEQWARKSWDVHRHHPWTLPIAAIRRLPGPNEMDCFEAGLRAVADSGLRPSEQVAAVTLLGRWVQSEAAVVAQAAATQRRTGVSDEEWWSSRDAFWEHFDVERYRRVSALWEAGAYDAPEDPFEFGLERVLDGIELLVRRS